MKMLKYGPIWSILKHHRPSERFFFLAIANEISKILMVYAGQRINLQHLKTISGIEDLEIWESQIQSFLFRF